MERYWTGYTFMKGWMQKHAAVVADIQEQIGPSSSQNKSDVHIQPHLPSQSDQGQASHPIPYSNNRQKGVGVPEKAMGSLSEYRTTTKRKKRQPKSTSGHRRSRSSSYQAELDQDFINFMAHSAKHKREREAAKSRQERLQTAENGENDRIAAPTEQPGLRRTHEIRLLYGDRAVQVHGLETAQQLTFQQDCDRQKPRYWPSIPLRLTFD